MSRSSCLLATTLIGLGIVVCGGAFADTTSSETSAPSSQNTQLKCAMDEYPSTENGVAMCKKVPSCSSKNEVISYDATIQKFVCKKLVQCDPKRQQAAFVNGKNVCIDVPDCEKQGKHYAFDGSKMVCQ